MGVAFGGVLRKMGHFSVKFVFCVGRRQPFKVRP